MIQDRQSEGILLITGGAHRVGLHCARFLAQSGYRIHITYKSERPIVTELRSEGIVCHQVDFEYDDPLHDWLEFLRCDAPPVRALVHNASSWLADFEEGADLLQTMRRMNRIHCEVPYLMNFAADVPRRRR